MVNHHRDDHRLYASAHKPLTSIPLEIIPATAGDPCIARKTPNEMCPKVVINIANSKVN